MKRFLSSTLWGYPVWPFFIVIAGGAGSGFSYKFYQVSYIYLEAWKTYPLSLVVPNIIIGIILCLAFWIGYCTFLSWVSSKPIQTFLKVDSFSFLLLILVFGVPYLPLSLPGIIIKIFIVWKLFFLLINLCFCRRIIPKMFIHGATLIDVALLGIICAFIWLNTINLDLGRGVNAHLSVKAAQLAKYCQYPAWNPEMYAGGWSFTYGQVYGYIWYWLIGFLPISPLLMRQFICFETFLPMYFMIIFSCVSFYFLLKKSFRLSRPTSIFGGLIYLLNFYMQGIILIETNHAFAYLIFPSVFLVAERGLKNRNLLLACLSGLLINLLMPATYAHPESFYIFYFIIGFFYILAALFYYGRKSIFPLVSLIIFGISHLVFLNYYLPIFEYMFVFKEVVHFKEEGARLLGFGSYVPLFYPFYIGIMPAFLVMYAFFRFRKIIQKNSPSSFFLSIFSFLMFIFLSIVQLGKEVPLYSFLKLPEAYIFPFVRFWLRFAPGLFFFHYVIACLGLEYLLKYVDQYFDKFEFPECVNTKIGKISYYFYHHIKKKWVLTSFLSLATIMIVGKFFSRLGPLDINPFVISYFGGIRDVEFFWVYIIIGLVALSSILFINKRYLRIPIFFVLSVAPLLHYMEPALNLFSPPTFKNKFASLKNIYSAGIKTEILRGMNDRQVLLAYIKRNPQDTIALNAFNEYLATDKLCGESLLLSNKLCFNTDNDFMVKLNYLRAKVLPQDNNFLAGYLSDDGFSRFAEIGRATKSFSFQYHQGYLANVIFNLGGNVGSVRSWRWFHQFDGFFSSELNLFRLDFPWSIRLVDLLDRFWPINLLGVKHFLISEEDYFNMIKNSSFESWTNEIPVPAEWKLKGSSGSVKKGPDSGVEFSSGPMTQKGRDCELVQDITELKENEFMYGETYVFGVWVKASVPDSVCISIRDQHNQARSMYHTGSGKWEFLIVDKFIWRTVYEEPTVEALLAIENKNMTAQFARPVFLIGSLALKNILEENALQDNKRLDLLRNLPLKVEGEAFDYGHKIILLRNDSALPLMFLANGYKLLNPGLEKEEKWQVLKQIDHRSTILLEEEPILPQLKLWKNRSTQNNLLDAESVRIIDIRGNIAAAIVSVTDANGYLFYSDNYHPGWSAFIDGIPTKVYRADLAFKAIIVPKGRHLVWFEFRPASLWIGIYISSLAILVIIIAASRNFMFYKKKSY